MATTIKPIEASSIHQIQSGQVIVDLCSVVKELVENALDAEANSIEVRFKNYGLDAIEVQDNGTGIAESNYEGLALKHYTSKLSTYDDLDSLRTFGFRGEALSSLCALSTLSVVTAQAHEAPKGKRLEFETSGKLKTTSLVAAQKGTTVTVENLFSKLPVRQKELSKNVKREYGKVLSLLHAYACISTGVKFTVKHTPQKGRGGVVFSTKGNGTTRENIANVYGAKMLSQLIELDLALDFPSTSTRVGRSDTDAARVEVIGHISKPVFGEGRQTPDRQMFFVNGRPCGLPQIAKAINEVYKSYNVSQSAFIVADFRMDTSNYDVNVSPDKRTILLHNAGALTDRLKDALVKKFDETEQTVPHAELQDKKLPAFKQLIVSREASGEDAETLPRILSPYSSHQSIDIDEAKDDTEGEGQDTGARKSENNSERSEYLFKARFGNVASTREEELIVKKTLHPHGAQKGVENQAEKAARAIERREKLENEVDEDDDVRDVVTPVGGERSGSEEPVNMHVRDFNARMQEQQKSAIGGKGDSGSALHFSANGPDSAQKRRFEDRGVVPNAFDRMRPRRPSPELATITVGDRVITKMIGTPKGRVHPTDGPTASRKNASASQLAQSLYRFGAGMEKDTLDDSKVGYGVGIEEAKSDGHVGDRDGSHNDGDGIAIRAGQLDADHGVGGFPNTQHALFASHKEELNQAAERTQEEYRVAELIRMAETTNYANSKERQKRANQALKATSKDSTVDIVAVADESLDTVVEQMTRMKRLQAARHAQQRREPLSKEPAGQSDEEQLSLTISKPDFAKMHIAGQFNLGFILAVRHRDPTDRARRKDELFIIDQHASDEKYNFERLQAETVVGNQRLVHPVMLDLTAVEEEIVLENEHALRQNGFIVESDISGATPVGQRCRLLSLPLSKEVTFNIKDLEELIHLLSDSHVSADSAYIPRPGKVRKMFAMRACRSSIMIGKTLSMRQMRNVLDHMGRIDKPWNCPHGRPTMRHLISLDQLEGQLWREGDGLVSEGEGTQNRSDVDIWKQYAAENAS